MYNCILGLSYSVLPIFVYPQLLHGVEVYANTCKSHLEKLIVLNNELLRIAQNCSVRVMLNYVGEYGEYCDAGDA